MMETTSASPLANDTAANIRVVETFLYAMQDDDYDAAAATLADDILYENVGYTTMRGRERIIKMFRFTQGRIGFEVRIHRVAAEGNAVLVERIDALILGPVRLQFWACGIFEVHDGRITLWRDYFDALDFFIKAPLRGLLGAVIPSLRPTM